MTEIIKAVILSIFGDEGPIPEVVLINDDDGIHIHKKDSIKDIESPPLDLQALLHIAMKSVSLLMGEHTYQDGDTDVDAIKYSGILPFPDIKMEGLTYFFLIPDEEARGAARASTITVLVSEINKGLIWERWTELRTIIAEQAAKLTRMMSQDEFSDVMVELLKSINSFIEQISYPLSTKRNVKIVFAGLDNSGKTSMILGLEKKYSKMINVQPTKGVNRTQSTILGMTISVWDLGGQQQYRHQYVKDAELYLFDCDLIFYLIDVRDQKRFKESIDYYTQILHVLSKFEQNPPVIVCLHKSEVSSDADAANTLKENIEEIRQSVEAISEEFIVKFFETSIFEPYSLITAFSYGLAALSPNRDIFRHQLEKLAKLTGAQSIILINEKGLIMSDYSADDATGKIFELSAPHFTSLYNNFEQFVSGENKKAVYMLGDTYISFHVMEFELFNIYVLSFLNDQESIDKIEENLPEFKDNIQQLLNTYF
ncbi:MAG TPA: ADP-ribosylation factor-like protein [Candidatus Lokiarchaeia archaeon]|nr:ADP-ribosylation factor-like protein [Candidatus Lokiarchaeia archaeon]